MTSNSYGRRELTAGIPSAWPVTLSQTETCNLLVDAADKRAPAVYDHKLVVHAAQHVDAGAEQALRGLEAAQLDAGVEQRLRKRRRQVGRAPAIDQHVHLGAPPGGAKQRLLKIAPNPVVEQDECFEQHFVLGRADRIEHTREVFLAVLEQRDVVARYPVRVHVWQACAEQTVRTVR